MIFSELYSAYYNAIAAILADVLRGNTDERALQETVKRHAFSESILTILPALKGEKWQLLKRELTTPIRHIPTMPLTLLEKRWLKAVSLDPRIRLFDLSFQGLDGIDPLFTPDDYVLYDKYADGDPYLDEGYITRFRTILRALREKYPLTVEAVSRKGGLLRVHVFPLRLEYSEKDDKFRLITCGSRHGGTINLARIVTCRRYEGKGLVPACQKPAAFETVTLKICDDRNALERCMLHFSNFEKQAERVDDTHYLVSIRYDRDDETEMVIRILGFGPLVEVVGPDSFRSRIIQRLWQQKSCGLPSAEGT